jgi:UDP-GlcNAc:undecaprenyl-phosphate GlcNAc-1-phosphate transferase
LESARSIPLLEGSWKFSAMFYLILLLIATGMAAFLTKVVRDLAIKKGLAFGPSSARHIHATPVPRLGGIAIFLTCLNISLLYWASIRLGWVHHPTTFGFRYVILPATGLFMVGLIDDFRGIPAIAKLIAQIASGASLYFAGFRLVRLDTVGGSDHLTSALSFGLTVGCVVLICNAINLIDGLDGLAAGATLFSMVTIFTFALANGRHGTALAVAVLAGANLGFLVFNFNPASIFLGDSGSLFIGFVLSTVIMSESTKQSDPLRSILVPIISLALPLTDLLLTVARRYLSGHSIFGADREHIHHKLLELGMSQRQVVAILYAFSATCVVLSLTLLHPSRLVVLPVIAILALVIFFGIRRLKYKEFIELERFASRMRQQRRVAEANIALRKSAARLQESEKAVQIAKILEDCLRRDFDAFRILLDPGHWVTIESDDAPTRLIEKSWSADHSDKLTLTMDLTTARYGKVGRFSIEHNAGKRLLADSRLLQGELLHALGVALDRCLITMPEAFVVDRTSKIVRRILRNP